MSDTKAAKHNLDHVLRVMKRAREVEGHTMCVWPGDVASVEEAAAALTASLSREAALREALERGAKLLAAALKHIDTVEQFRLAQEIGTFVSLYGDRKPIA